ncbi:membrane protein [Amycolatopsis rifamycinica]|uniref:Membrane protein n=1 Tax=Amycolatopsis rifamycinica TaxID=287986 RepID=A0A066TX21_9PSEU|nr:membrane protein [Amycolatopsis rifamycinica]KDN19395.1 membrane protein [Amycolatopsis rifamycinica]
MTDTGGAPGGEGADTPTPSQGVPSASAPGSGEPKRPEDHGASPATPPRGWQAPDAQAAPPTPPPGWQHAPAHQPGALPPFTGQQQPQYQQQYQPPRWNPHGLGKPGVIALRPLNIGDILDGAITAIRRHALLVLGIGAVVAVITAALTFVLQKYLLTDLKGFATTVELGPAATDEELRNALFGTFGDLFVVLISSTLLSTFLLTVTTGLMAAVMGRAALGREVTFGIAWREVQPRLLPLLGVAFVYALLSTIGVMLCIIPGVLAWVFWALAAPALVLERGTFREAFARSVKLVGGAFWRVLGVLLLARIIESFFENIIQLPFTVGTGVFSQMFTPGKVTVPSTGDLLLAAAGQIIAGTVAIPFVALVTVIVYLDQRMRREGMDIELARAAGVQPPQAW